MHQWVENRAIHPDHLHDSPGKVWHDCVDHFLLTVGPNFTGLSNNQMLSHVYHARDHVTGRNVISTVRAPVLHPIFTNITNTANAAATTPASADDDATSLTSIVTESTCPVTSADACLESPKKKKSQDQAENSMV